ncbi:MAG: hypothetical protein ACYC6A_20080 [Armatimonadota bacterium]
MMHYKFAVLAAVLVGVGLIARAEQVEKPTPVSPKVEKEIRKQGQEILALLKQQDFKTLAKYIHPQQGVRFSPYAYVDVKTDRRYTQTPLADAWNDRKTYLWGYYDGSGDPITLSFRKYYEQFIFNRDFTEAPDVSFNKLIETGNTVSNLDDVYSNFVFMEYHFPGKDDQPWASLRLVFKPYGKGWRLVGIVNDGWTI